MRGETLIFRQNDESHFIKLFDDRFQKQLLHIFPPWFTFRENRDNSLAGTGKFIILILTLNFSLFDCEKMK